MPTDCTTLLLLSLQCAGGGLPQSRALEELLVQQSSWLTLLAVPCPCFIVGETRYGHAPCSGLGGMGQSPEDFDSASLEEEQGMAGGVLAGTALMEGGQRTVWKGSVMWKPRGDLTLRDPGLPPCPPANY